MSDSLRSEESTPPGDSFIAPRAALGGCVLVVDDNDVNRDLMKLRLELRGYDVELAEGGAEALALLGKGSLAGPYDAVLLDVMMPEVSGLDVLREVRKWRTLDELPVIMQTAKDESSDIVEALLLGANDYVTKPVDFPVLFARLETQLRVKRLAAERREFLAIASHDLKNPLAVVRGYAKMLTILQPEGSPTTTESRELLERIGVQTITMERIIGDYLDFQAMEDGRLALKRTPVNLTDVAQEVVELQSGRAAEKKIELRLLEDEPAGEAINVRGDELRLRQILENLVGNAVKFSPDGGAVEVALRRAGLPVDGDANRSDPGTGGEARGGILVQVRDTGPGVPESERHRLFMKYARLSNKPTGGEKSSGLGLAIARRLVELHGGKIGARNNAPAPGATFWFWLPTH